ncbi:MAG: TrmH family RNA methyltransferase [Patescibacteria group bacterium]
MSKKGNTKIAVVLHNVRSLHNVGSVFRTADAAGVHKIYLCGFTPSPLDRFGKVRPQFAKVALGAEKYVKWKKLSKTTAAIEELKKEKYKIFAVEQSPKSVPYDRADRISKKDKIALVFGNEVRGLPQGVLKLADKILEIPMYGKKESLNVSVAVGIVLFRFRSGS